MLNIEATPNFSDGIVLSGHIPSQESYNLEDDDLNVIENRVVKDLFEAGITEGIAVVVIEGDNQIGDFGRTLENRIFNQEKRQEGYDFFSGMSPYENRSRFVLTVDTDLRKVAHVKRIVMPFDDIGKREDGLTGIEVLDDRISADPGCIEYLSSEYVFEVNGSEELSQSINVATNFRTSMGSEGNSALYTATSYKAVFMLAGEGGVFAYLNEAATRSLGYIDLEFGGIAPDIDFHLPKTYPETGYDDDYRAVHIPRTQHNIDVFTKGIEGKPLTEFMASINPMTSSYVGGSLVLM
jgi:hypothetical protein